MGYESLSSIVLVAIAALLAFVWAPRKARAGMKRASEHRADRFSPSLHLVDASSATRFNDTTPPITKGLLMQAEQRRKASRLTPARIAHIRKLRRAAIRRRQMLVSSLAVIAIVVLVMAFALEFSPLFSLIPVALLVIVLGFGAHASAQARAWEAEVAAMARRGAGAAQILPQTVGPVAQVPPAVAGNGDGAASDGRVESSRSVEEAASVTGVMPADEIRAALDQARAEQRAAKTERAAERAFEDPASSAAAVVSDSAAEDVVADAAQVAAVAAEPEDATNELARISPSHALDAFEMAASQDLISFSLGASRSGRPVVQAEPESLEIKSTRRVSKAEPVQTESVQSEPVEDEAKDPEASSGRDGAELDDQADQDRTASFHEAELSGEVEAPSASSDSLGVDVDAVIARRGH